jgi:hypothetical protein
MILYSMPYHMKRKTYNRLHKLYEYHSKAISDLFAFSDDGFDLDATIQNFKGKMDIINAALRLYERLYVSECFYADIEKYASEMDSLDTLAGELSYISDRWGSWHRLRLMQEAPKIYDKLTNRQRATE